MGIFCHKFPNVLERYSVFPPKKIEKCFLYIYIFRQLDLKNWHLFCWASEIKSSYFCSKAIFQFSQASGIKSYTTSYYTFIAKKLPCPNLLMTRKFLLTCNFFSDDKSKF